MIGLIDLPIDPMDVPDDTPCLASFFPNLFAEALVPVNPRHWPSYVAGSTMASEMPEFGDKIQTPLNNLLVSKEFLETSQSDVQWRDRFWRFVEDTFTINGACEVGGEAGSFAAGAAANKIADGYVDEMVETAATLKPSEKLNQRIYEQFAEQNGADPGMVRGTGLGRQFVPPGSRGNILNRPARGSRPLWAYRHVRPGRGPFGFILPVFFNRRTALQLAKRLLSNNTYSVIKEIVVVYTYFRYVKLVCKVGRKFLPKVYKTIKKKSVALYKKLNHKRNFKKDPLNKSVLQL